MCNFFYRRENRAFKKDRRLGRILALPSASKYLTHLTQKYNYISFFASLTLFGFGILDIDCIHTFAVFVFSRELTQMKHELLSD